jgi:hypothetical protein
MLGVPVYRAGVPASPPELAPVFPHKVFAAPGFRVLMGRAGTLTLAFHQFPGIFDYILWKGHIAPPHRKIAGFRRIVRL